MNQERELAEDRLADTSGYLTRHQQRVIEMMKRDPNFAEAYTHFMAELDAHEDVDDMGDPMDTDAEANTKSAPLDS